jgi:hypothetical protein
MLIERLDWYFTRVFSTIDTKILFQIFRSSSSLLR